MTPMAHATHVADFLFFRVDLVNEEWAPGCEPPPPDRSVVTYEEYSAIKAQLDARADTEGGRGAAAMALIEGHVGALLPLSDLASNLNAEAKRTGQALPRVRFLVGGPLGPVQRLLAESPELGAQLNDVSGQLATWNASSANLFPNQFNVACDPNAAIQLTSKPDCQMNLVSGTMQL